MAGGSDSARIIAVANQKGGVGKSTTAVSLGASLAELGHRVLVVDLDPQGNASTGLGIRHEERDVTVYDVLAADAPMEAAVVPTPIDNLFAIPSTIDLAGAEIELVSQFSRELRLRKAIEPLRHGAYDYVFLDCPPSLGLLTVNALAAAEELIVPIQCEYYALEGLGQLLRNVRLVQQNVNTSLRLTGIVMTMFDPRTRLSEQVVAEVRRYFGDRVYKTIIPRTVRLSEAPGFGQPITVYDPNSKGAQSYRALAKEVAARLPDESPLPIVEDVPTVVMPAPEPHAARAPRPLVGPDDLDEPDEVEVTQDIGEEPQVEAEVESASPVEPAPEPSGEPARTDAQAEVDGSKAGPTASEPEQAVAPGERSAEPEQAVAPGERSAEPEQAVAPGERSAEPEKEAAPGERSAEPEPNAHMKEPADGPPQREISAPEPNGDGDLSASVEGSSTHDDAPGAAGNGDRSEGEAEEPTSSGSGKRLRRFFRRGET